MQEYITMRIDGANVRVHQGSTVLDAALEYGFCIPHLCHVQGLLPVGACRLCVVELGERGRSKVTASCTLDAREGMVVRTNTDRIQKLRRGLAELLVAEAPNSRAVQDIAARCGVKEVRYPFRNEGCVLCERCVRQCSDMWSGDALGAVGRGRARAIDMPFGTRPESCKECHACVDTCPMTLASCEGIMKPGEEHLCGLCSSQVSMADALPGACVQCDLGEGFGCSRRRA